VGIGQFGAASVTRRRVKCKSPSSSTMTSPLEGGRRGPAGERRTVPPNRAGSDRHDLPHPPRRVPSLSSMNSTSGSFGRSREELVGTSIYSVQATGNQSRDSRGDCPVGRLGSPRSRWICRSPSPTGRNGWMQWTHRALLQRGRADRRVTGDGLGRHGPEDD